MSHNSPGIYLTCIASISSCSHDIGVFSIIDESALLIPFGGCSVSLTAKGPANPLSGPI